MVSSVPRAIMQQPDRLLRKASYCSRTGTTVSYTHIIAGYSVTRQGALAGVRFFLVPNVANFSWMTVVTAMGQMFYSLSIAMGILVTFGSYMKKDVSIEESTENVELFDTAIAIIHPYAAYDLKTSKEGCAAYCASSIAPR